MRDGTLPLADVGDDGYLSFDEFAEFHYLGDEDYLDSVYFLYREYSWIFEHTRSFSPQELFNIADSDGDGFITSTTSSILEMNLRMTWNFIGISAR